MLQNMLIVRNAEETKDQKLEISLIEEKLKKANLIEIPKE